MASTYVITAICAGVPAFLSSIAAVYEIHKGRKENSGDHARVKAGLERLDTRLERLDTKIEGVDIKIEKTDLRFDAIEDKIERHLGWHRTQAELDLEQALKKEVSNGGNDH